MSHGGSGGATTRHKVGRKRTRAGLGLLYLLTELLDRFVASERRTDGSVGRCNLGFGYARGSGDALRLGFRGKRTRRRRGQTLYRPSGSLGVRAKKPSRAQTRARVRFDEGARRGMTSGDHRSVVEREKREGRS